MNTQKTLPKLFIFDMDGLIFNTERLFMTKKHEILKDYGYEARLEDYLQTIGLAGEPLMQKLLEIYGDDYPAMEISQKARAATTAHMETFGPEVKPGIRELLLWLKEKGIPCCVASSSLHKYVEKYLEMANLLPFFSFIIGGDEVPISKPNPEIFLTACRHFQVDPSDALVLEDSENGIRAAWNGGIPAICIPDLKYPSEEIQKKTLAILESASDVITYF